MREPKKNGRNGHAALRYVTLAEAAVRIGITSGRLRQLIRAGDLKAEKVEGPVGRFSYYYQISTHEIERFLAQPRSPGRPRVGDAT